MASNEQAQEMSADEDRRKFLETCGKFAAVTPPAITLLLSTSLNSGAIASSGQGQNNNDQGQNNNDQGQNNNHQ
jgi:hypothetical protein